MFSKLSTKDSLKTLYNYEALIDLYKNNQQEAIVINADTINTEQTNYILILEIVALSYFDLQQYDHCLKLITKIEKDKPDFLRINDLKGNALTKLSLFEEAIQTYKTYLQASKNKYKIYNKIANVYYFNNNHQIAVKYYLKSIKAVSKNIEAYTNLGKIFIELKKPDLAIYNINKAIAINPNYAPAYNNLGLALIDKEENNQAIKSFLKAIECDDNYTDSYVNLASTLFEKGNFKDTIALFKQAFYKNHLGANHLKTLALSYSKTILNDYDERDTELILKILKYKNLIHPAQISNTIFSIFLNYINKKQRETDNNELELLQNLSNHNLFMYFFRMSVTANLEIEKIFTRSRKFILTNNLYDTGINNIENFQVTLAIQNYLNGFIHHESKEEKVLIKNLEKEIALEINNNIFNVNKILCLGSYRSLQKYPLLGQKTNFTSLKRVTDIHIKNNNIEAEEIKKINCLTNVTDDVSMLVKRQYEENPYPVWEVTYLYESKYSIYDYFVKNNLKTDKINMLNSENNDILIAGSGTGQHAIQSSSRFKNSNVLAIDLSCRSTAYAIRKANELGVNNIKFMIADILDLKKLNKSFTIIESCGVLHHLENPLDGWSELVKKLKPNGLMRIGLYSKLGRRDVKKARDIIKKNKLSPNKNNMLNFRQEILENNKFNLKKLTNFPDFYSMNEYRDLIFHFKEHHFDLIEINEMINHLGLTFMGFELKDNYIKKSFEDKFPNPDDYYSLKLWDEYERENPDTFRNMYDFWVRL